MNEGESEARAKRGPSHVQQIVVRFTISPVPVFSFSEFVSSGALAPFINQSAQEYLVSTISKYKIATLLAKAGVTVNGPKSWDIQIHDERLFDRILKGGTIELGRAYMDGWWSVQDLSTFFAKLFEANLAHEAYRMLWKEFVWNYLRQQIFNRQSRRRAFQIGERHYDIGNDLFKAMLDPTMTYSCGYWRNAQSLHEAQRAKYDLVCRKLGLKQGDRVLEIGCGWGGFLIYAAQVYGINGVGVTVSEKQVDLANERKGDLPLEFRLEDYRRITDKPFDHVVSIGMFEHVGRKNYRTYFETVRKLLKEDGLFLLHTIGHATSAWALDPWIEHYIFPNGYVPSLAQITRAIDRRLMGNALFVVEDYHNFGADYDKTLMAWYANFEAAWPTLQGKTYDERFYRMWTYYLLSCAGGFRAREMQLYQLVLSPKGVRGGYRRVN